MFRVVKGYKIIYRGKIIYVKWYICFNIKNVF